MADHNEQHEDRETLDLSIRVRVSERVHSRLLSVVGQTGTVSEYVRRLLEAAMNEEGTAHTAQFVPQTLDELRDMV